MGRSISRLRHADLGELIRAAQHSDADDSPTMNEIVRRFESLAAKVARAVTGDSHLRDELTNAGRLAVVQAVRAHDAARAGFPNYVRAYIRGAVYRAALRSHGTDYAEVAREETTELEAPSTPVAGHNPWDTLRMATAVRALDESQQRLVLKRYVDDLSMLEIAADVDTSVSAVSQRFATIHRTLAESLAA